MKFCNILTKEIVSIKRDSPNTMKSGMVLKWISLKAASNGKGSSGKIKQLSRKQYNSLTLQRKIWQRPTDSSNMQISLNRCVGPGLAINGTKIKVKIAKIAAKSGARFTDVNEGQEMK